MNRIDYTYSISGKIKNLKPDDAEKDIFFVLALRFMQEYFEACEIDLKRIAIVNSTFDPIDSESAPSFRSYEGDTK